MPYVPGSVLMPPFPPGYKEPAETAAIDSLLPAGDVERLRGGNFLCTTYRKRDRIPAVFRREGTTWAYVKEHISSDYPGNSFWYLKGGITNACWVRFEGGLPGAGGGGTEWRTSTTYPVNINDPMWGKDGDYLVVATTNNVYQRSNGSWPAVDAPTLELGGTRVTTVVFDLAPGAARRVPFFATVLLESLRVSYGPDSFSVRLLLPDGTVQASAAGAGVACIGTMSVAIDALTPAQVGNGYNVEFTNTGNAATTAQLRALPV